MCLIRNHMETGQGRLDAEGRAYGEQAGFREGSTVGAGGKQQTWPGVPESVEV